MHIRQWSTRSRRVALFTRPWPERPGISARMHVRLAYYLADASQRGFREINRSTSAGTSPRNGPPAAWPAAKVSGGVRWAVRYSSSSARPSPSCRTVSARGQNPSRRRSAWWSHAASWRTVCTGSTRSATADTQTRVWPSIVDHRPAVPVEVVTTAASRSPRVATCKPRTRGRKLDTPPAAPLAWEVIGCCLYQACFWWYPTRIREEGAEREAWTTRVVLDSTSARHAWISGDG